MPCVIVISGAPAAGKSTLAQLLSRELGWPLFAKDELKELLFDCLGCRDREWSKQVSGAAYAMMFASAGKVATANQSCIIEGNFRWEERRENFAELAAIPGVRLLQVFVTAELATLVSRFDRRTAHRHPGHVDAGAREEIVRELREQPPRPLPLTCELIEFWSEGPSVETAGLVERVRCWAYFSSTSSTVA